MNDARRSAEWKPGSVGPVAEIRSNRVEFFVPGLPVAQPRQRHANIGGHVRSYLPKTDPVNSFKATVRLACREALPDDWDFNARMRLVVICIFPRPQTRTKKRGNERTPKATKPDWDNLGKSVSDALNGIAWNDDKQIWDGRVFKFEAGDGDQVGVRISIEGKT